MIYAALEKFGIVADSWEILQDKDGVTTARIFSCGNSSVLKYFRDEGSRREISNYRLLNELHIPTLKLIAASDDAIIIEDIARSRWRLAERADMDSCKTARNLADWYKKLHARGREYAAAHGRKMYSERDLFTRENAARVRKMSGTGGQRFWEALESRFDDIVSFMSALPMTITYNDFYYTNMAVARDGMSAIMFDYNILGRSHACCDLRNVTYSLSERAGAAFMEAYGTYDRREALLDDVISPIVTLHMAYGRKNFPEWGRQTLADMKNDYARRLAVLCEAMDTDINGGILWNCHTR